MSRCKLDLPRLRAAEDELLGAKRSENTQRAYRTSWRAFERWAMEADLTAAPAEASTVRLFVLWCIDGAEYRLSSIRLHLAAIRAQHLDAGGNSPVDDRARNLVRAAARKLRQRPKKAEALSPFVLAAMSQALKTGAGSKTFGIAPCCSSASRLAGGEAKSPRSISPTWNLRRKVRPLARGVEDGPGRHARPRDGHRLRKQTGDLSCDCLARVDCAAGRVRRAAIPQRRAESKRPADE